MGEIKVSIVMPVLNVKDYIRECLDSAVGQTLKEIEIICVDAYSTDGTREIVLEYAQKDSRIKLINDDRGSTGYANNIGIQMASGKYIAILETDDYIAPDMYEILYSIAERENCDIVKADYKVFWGNGEERVFLNKPIAFDSQMYERDLSAKRDHRIFINDMSTWAGIYRRGFLLENQIWHNETPGAAYQDNGFWFQTVVLAEKIWYVPSSGYRYRLDNPNSSMHNPKKIYAICDEYGFIREQLEIRGIYSEYCFMYVYIKYVRYLSSFYRLHPDLRMRFLNRFSEEMREHMDKNEIAWDMFSEPQRKELRNILADSQKFYEDILARQRDLAHFIREQKKIVQFGCGSDGIRFLSFMKENGGIKNIACVMDNNPKLHGMKIFGIPIVPPSKAGTDYRNHGYVITSLNYAAEMKRQLCGMGIQEEKMKISDMY